MEIKIYQIDLDRDWNDIAFLPFERVAEREIDPVSYDCVYQGEFPARNLEEVFAKLNADNPPDGYIGISMSISDVCEVKKMENPNFSMWIPWDLRRLILMPVSHWHIRSQI